MAATDLERARAFSKARWDARRDRVAWFKDPDGNTLSLTRFP